MTYHIKLKEYSCAKCNMAYLPIYLDYPCPKCGFVSQEDNRPYTTFIDEILGSMIINKREYGRYIPDAWYTGSTSDAVQSSCFELFYILEKKKISDPIAFIDDYTACMEVDDEYNRKYIKDVFIEVNKRYQTEKEPRLTKKSLLLRLLRTLIR